MNFRSIPRDGGPVAPVQASLVEQVGIWRDLLAECARKPSRKRVRALRSLTLRLRAAVEFLVVEGAAGAACSRTFRRWKKEGKKLRRTLAPVRDADVYLARLGSLRDESGTPTAGKRHLSPNCWSEIDKLESRLRHRRQKGIDDLIALLDARGKRLSGLSEEMVAAAGSQNPSTMGSTAQAALRTYARLAGELPGLEGDNLHSFRKRLKQALYLAEMSARFDPEAGRLVALLRKMHLATGEWHDWQALALEAGRILSRCAKKDGVVPLLEHTAEEALKKALSVCRRSTAHLLGKSGETRRPSSRKSVDSVPRGSTRDRQTSLKIAD
jgi:CHAD domain-containing protein